MVTMEATPGGTDREPDTDTETENTFDSTFNTARDQVRSSTSLPRKFVDEDLDVMSRKFLARRNLEFNQAPQLTAVLEPSMPDLPF